MPSEGTQQAGTPEEGSGTDCIGLSLGVPLRTCSSRLLRLSLTQTLLRLLASLEGGHAFTSLVMRPIHSPSA